RDAAGPPRRDLLSGGHRDREDARGLRSGRSPSAPEGPALGPAVAEGATSYRVQTASTLLPSGSTRSAGDGAAGPCVPLTSKVIARGVWRCEEMAMTTPTPDLDLLIERYVAQWHEPDAAARRRRIEEIWVPDGANFTRSFEVRGHDALEARVRA